VPREASRRNVSSDAVVVVPGVMGSCLVDTTTSEYIWGLDPAWYVRAWLGDRAWRRLELSEDERSGRLGRVAPSGLLRATAFAPVLAGVEPYAKLVKRIADVVVNPRAVLEFAYDWRLPVNHNAHLLAEAASAHLDRWRRDEAYRSAMSDRPDAPDARLVLVAHSMGGLLCQAAVAELTDVRTVITLGTPFDGAAKVGALLNVGRGGPVPLPKRRLRRLAATLPGLHDLLPTYRCLNSRIDDTVRRLGPADVAALGGDPDLAARAFADHAVRASQAIPGHHALVGTDQPTVQSISMRDGVVVEHRHSAVPTADGELERDRDGRLIQIDRLGDGTVPRTSASPPTGGAHPAAQQHGALAKADEAVSYVCALIRDERTELGPRLGDAEIGLDLPDVVMPGTPWAATITGAAPHEASCRVLDVQTGQVVDHPILSRADGEVRAAVTLPEPGLYRVEVSGGGSSAVTQIVLAVDTSHDDELD
jgi:lecithin:cholesterol acyltransferase